MSIAGALPGIGAAVTGFMNGQRIAREETRQDTLDQRRMAREDADQSFDNEQRGRVRKTWNEQDRVTSAVDEANAAARKLYGDMMRPKGLNSSETQSPDGARVEGDQAPQKGLGAPTLPPGAYNGEAATKAMEARTAHLLKTLGPGKEWLESWRHEADARGQLRGEYMDKAYAQYKVDGDPAGLLKATYPWVADGWDLADAKTVQGDDGKPVVQATRVNRTTGATEQKTIPQQELLNSFTWLRDPTNARMIEAQAATAAAKAAREQRDKLEVVAATGAQSRETEDLRAKHRRDELAGKPPGYSAPQQAINPDTGEPEFVQFSDRPGAAPRFTGVRPPKKAENTKAIPDSAVKAIAENRNALSKIDEAMKLIGSNPDALGVKNYLPDALTQRVDPEGVAARAAISDLGSLKIHDRSGAAVTVGEMARLKPFIPAATDDPKTVQTKLTQFRAEYANVLADLQEAYSPENGYRPNTLLRKPGAEGGASETAAGRNAQQAPKVGTVSRGYTYTGGDPSSPSSWRKQ